MAQPPQLIFTQAMLSLPPSNWTLTGVFICPCYDSLYHFFRRAILERKDRKKSSAASGDVEMVDVSSSAYLCYINN